MPAHKHNLAASTGLALFLALGAKACATSPAEQPSETHPSTAAAVPLEPRAVNLRADLAFALTGERIWQATHPSMGLAVTIEPSGAHIALPTSDLHIDGKPRYPSGLGTTLRWTGVGRGDALATPALHDARVHYEHNRLAFELADGSRLWWVHDDEGLEQAFTVPARPPGDEPLTIEVAFDGLEAVVADVATGKVALRHEGRAVAWYRGLEARDSRGAALRTWAEQAGARVRLRVDDAGAHYPVLIDPWVATLDHSFNSSGGDELDLFGDVAVIATRQQNGCSSSGEPTVSVSAFRRLSGVWSSYSLPTPDVPDLCAECCANNMICDEFGACSNDCDSGAGGGFSQQACDDCCAANQICDEDNVCFDACSGASLEVLVSAPVAGDDFIAARVDVYSVDQQQIEQSYMGIWDFDGSWTSTLLVDGGGALGATSGRAVLGTTVYERQGTTWLPMPGALVGNARARDIDGDVVVVGGDKQASIYEPVGGTWVKTASLETTWKVAADVPASFGESVAIGDGIVVIGAPLASSPAALGGAAYVFEKIGDDWERTAELVRPPFEDPFSYPSRARAGTRVAATRDIIALGSDTASDVGSCSDPSFVASGFVDIYARNAQNIWSYAHTITGSGDRFGMTLALHGSELLVGDHQSSLGRLHTLRRAAGAACDVDEQCDSALLCTDGVCCDVASCGGGPCFSCATPDQAGTCAAKPAGQPPTGGSCSGGDVCDGDGACVWGTLGTGCAADADCLSGLCIDDVCCDDACNGGCERCDVSGNEGRCRRLDNGTAQPACGAFVCDGASVNCPNQCNTSGDCAPDHYCNDGDCDQQNDAGLLCNGPQECKSGHCVKGRCCSSACSTPCATCDGGTCTAPDCAPNVCDVVSHECKQTCAGDAECTGDFYCDAETDSCVAKEQLGVACDLGLQCQSANCVNNQCCNTACDSPCSRCVGGACTVDDCGAYTCDPEANACRSGCLSGAECAGGFECSANGECTPTTQRSPQVVSTCGVAAPGRGSGLPQGALLIFGLGGMALCRRRRKRL